MTISALSKCAWLSSPASPLPSLPLQQPEALSDLCLAPSMPFRCLQAGRAPLPPLLLPFHLAPCDPALCRRNTLHKSFLWKMWRISQPLHAGWPLWQPGDSTVMPTPLPNTTSPPVSPPHLPGILLEHRCPVFRGKSLDVQGKKTEWFGDELCLAVGA